MFDETPMNPADIAAMTESAPNRARTAGKSGERRTSVEAEPMKGTSDAPIASDAAINDPNPSNRALHAGKTIADCHRFNGDHKPVAVSNPITSDAAMAETQPIRSSPHAGEPFPGTNPMYQPAIDSVVEFYRLRQDMIKARTKLILQAQAMLRRRNGGDKEAAAKSYAEVIKDETHELRPILSPYMTALEVLTKQQAEYEKLMVRNLKGLPILDWARGIKGFGDASLGCIIGECSGYRNDDGTFYSVGDFKSVSALWKRMGLAVLNGHRQGAPGKGASAEDWIAEGYSKSRRSVMWNVGNSLILSMGKFRPLYGEDVEANSDYTYLQKVFAIRARYEAQRLPHKDGTSIKESASGKDSYTLHAANRAKRYTEKRLLRMLFAEWRRCMS